MAIWFGHSPKRDNVNALRLRARGVAVLLFGVGNELRQQLLVFFSKEDQSLILEESEKALRYTTTERIDEISRYLEITVSRSLLREGSLERKLIANLETSFRNDIEAAGKRLLRRLHPADKITIGVAFQALSEGKANCRRQALVLSALTADVVRDVLDHLPFRIASSLEKTLPNVTRVRDRDRLQTLCDFLELSPEGRTLKELALEAQSTAKADPDEFAKQLQEWGRRAH